MFHLLGQNSYGKSAVRLVKVTRHGDRHDLKDVSVTLSVEGDFEPAFVAGDNSMILPTDTMKNTVYALAKRHGVGEIEPFGLALTGRVLDVHPAALRVRVEVAERLWKRLTVGGKPHDHAFLRPASEVRTAVVSRSREGASVESGLADLVILKTARSAFGGFFKDEYTTLEETSDRVFATSLTASWKYASAEVAYGPCWRGVRQLLLETFALHDSSSVQHTLYAMGEMALENTAEIAEIRLSMPNTHHLLVDLDRFGLRNENEIFVPTDEPYGLIEATIRRGSAPI